MKTFTLSVADVRQQAKNTKYSTHAFISNVDDLSRAVMFDHIAGLFMDDERGNDNLIEADCLIMDCDNDHTDNPTDWVTPSELAERLPDVAFAVVFSRSNDKEKHGRTARPRFHIYYPLSEPIKNTAGIRRMKEKLLVLVPEFDKGAKDAARFIYGVEQPQINTIEGSMCIDEFLTIEEVEMPAKPKPHNEQNHADTVLSDAQELIPDVITAGDRHNTLLKIGITALSKYGVDKARNLLFKAAERCNPPKPVEEVNRLWDWLLKSRAGFKERFTEKKKNLTLQSVEEALQAQNISVSFDVIRKELVVSDLPQNNAHIPEAYKILDDYAKKKANASVLPLFMTSYLKEKGFTFSESFLTDSIAAIANLNRVNPVLKMIQATHWDGKDRISEICRVLGIQDNEHYCGFVRKWLHQAVSLALNDQGAINSEFVLVLQGAQGIGKTNFFRRLAIRPEWFIEGAVIDMRNKDSIIESTECWICELGELDATLKKEQVSLKAFITRPFDTYRRPYARKADKIERRTCFAATVNPETVNRDTTGSRRFIYIHIEAIDKHSVYNVMTPEWVCQLWRQVYDTLYTVNGRTGFYLTDDERAFAEESNEAFRVLLPAETELLDLIDFEECSNIDTEDNTPCKVFEWYTASEVKEHLKLNRYSAEQIGAALKALCERYPHCNRKRSHGRTSYFLPPIPDMRDN